MAVLERRGIRGGNPLFSCSPSQPRGHDFNSMDPVNHRFALSCPQPLMTAIGRSFTAFFEMPASWQVSTTDVTSCTAE